MDSANAFDIAFDRLMGNEGGYVNNPADPGGETNWGIAKRSYPDIDIKSLTRAQAKEIYRRDFWLRGQMDKFDGAIAFQAFDIAVNSGIETAVRMLQRAADVADDGHIGPVTMAAIKAKTVTDMLMLLNAERLDFYRKLSTFPTFGKGWVGRVANDLRYAAQDA
ncbi:glycoside hydrolase family 108 protein [Pandoraea apista]|uniref:glycoside hydrolase family 108 protein n=1 Tax=Pandoraea apista TaxID=93218 RepID=UPI001EE4F898|nr:glycosyl hydrolase 108 family protein [Pandoraea apista]